MAVYKWDNNTRSLFTVDTEGSYHSFDVMPAIESFVGNGSIKIWMTHGQLDRDCNKGPAFIHKTGDNTNMKFYKMGRLHNHIGGSAIIDRKSSNSDEANGKAFFLNGKSAIFKIIITNNYSINDAFIVNNNKLSVYIQDNKQLIIDHITGNIVKTLSIDDKIIPFVKDYVYRIIDTDIDSFNRTRFNCGCTFASNIQLHCNKSHKLIYCEICKKIATDGIIGRIIKSNYIIINDENILSDSYISVFIVNGKQIIVDCITGNLIKSVNIDDKIIEPHNCKIYGDYFMNDKLVINTKKLLYVDVNDDETLRLIYDLNTKKIYKTLGINDWIMCPSNSIEYLQFSSIIKNTFSCCDFVGKEVMKLPCNCIINLDTYIYLNDDTIYCEKCNKFVSLLAFT